MIKFILYSLFFAACLIWLSQNNGSMYIDWLGYQITVDLIFLIPAIVLLKILLLRLLMFVGQVRTSRNEMRKISALDNIVNGLAYLKLGDHVAARHCIAQAKKGLPNEAIVKLLEVHHLLSQDQLKQAKKLLLEIIDSNSILSSTALNQMLTIAYQENDLVEAENIINKMIKLFSKESWVLLKRSEFYCRVRRYEDALVDLQKVRKAKRNMDEDLQYKITLICYALAEKEYQKQNYHQALKYLSLSNNKKAIIGYALLQAKTYYALNKGRKALNLLEGTHQQQPHQDLIKAYVEYGGDINRLSSTDNVANSSWQCTHCYKKTKAWEYLCHHCDSLGTIRWL